MSIGCRPWLRKSLLQKFLMHKHTSSHVRFIGIFCNEQNAGTRRGTILQVAALHEVQAPTSGRFLKQYKSVLFPYIYAKSSFFSFSTYTFVQCTPRKLFVRNPLVHACCQTPMHHLLSHRMLLRSTSTRFSCQLERYFFPFLYFLFSCSL
jgi:hypothetical protein